MKRRKRATGDTDLIGPLLITVMILVLIAITLPK